MKRLSIMHHIKLGVFFSVLGCSNYMLSMHQDTNATATATASASATSSSTNSAQAVQPPHTSSSLPLKMHEFVGIDLQQLRTRDNYMSIFYKEFIKHDGSTAGIIRVLDRFSQKEREELRDIASKEHNKTLYNAIVKYMKADWHIQQTPMSDPQQTVSRIQEMAGAISQTSNENKNQVCEAFIAMRKLYDTVHFLENTTPDNLSKDPDLTGIDLQQTLKSLKKEVADGEEVIVSELKKLPAFNFIILDTVKTMLHGQQTTASWHYSLLDLAIVCQSMEGVKYIAQRIIAKNIMAHAIQVACAAKAPAMIKYLINQDARWTKAAYAASNDAQTTYAIWDHLTPGNQTLYRALCKTDNGKILGYLTSRPSTSSGSKAQSTSSSLPSLTCTSTAAPTCATATATQANSSAQSSDARPQQLSKKARKMLAAQQKAEQEAQAAQRAIAAQAAEEKRRQEGIAKAAQAKKDAAQKTREQRLIRSQQRRATEEQQALLAIATQKKELEEQARRAAEEEQQAHLAIAAKTMPSRRRQNGQDLLDGWRTYKPVPNPGPWERR